MGSTEQTFEGLDPRFYNLNEKEREIVSSLLVRLGRRFKEGVGHKALEINETYFSIYLQGFKELSIASIKILLRNYTSYFRQYVISKNEENIALVIEFYRNTYKDGKPLVHEFKTSKISFCNIKDKLVETNLTNDEKQTISELAQQFYFVEKYPSGDVVTSVNVDDDYYEIIFSNVRKIASGFISSYNRYFNKLSPAMTVISPNFEIVVRVPRYGNQKTLKETKKRSRDGSDEETTKRKK